MQKQFPNVFSLCGIGNKVKEDQKAQYIIVIDTLFFISIRINWVEAQYA